LFALSATGGMRGAFATLGIDVSFSILVLALVFFWASVSLLASKLLGVLPVQESFAYV
jgi:hypothetical protein